MSSTPLDRITISRLSLHLPHGLGPSGFNLSPPPPCQIFLSATVHLTPEIVPACTAGDNFDNLGVNYSALSKSIYALATSPDRVWTSPLVLLREVADLILGEGAVEEVHLEVGLPRAHLHAQEVVYEALFHRRRSGGQGAEGEGWRMELKGMEAKCVVGLHPYERKERQRVEWDIKLKDNALVEQERSIGHKELGDAAVEFVEASNFGTIEALAQSLTQHLLGVYISRSSSLPTATSAAGPSRHSSPRSGGPVIELTLRKPSALPFATPSITIRRSADNFPSLSSPVPSYSTLSLPASSATKGVDREAQGYAEKRVFIALGSNIGDRVSHIRSAVDALASAGCKLVRTSRLYESEPMYVEDQARFINGAIEIRTSLSPKDLLRLLKRTEKEVGRTKTFRNGPRVVDLDLLFYGPDKIREGNPGDAEDEDGIGWMQIPHPLIQEREFVLRPLADIAPTFIHPTLALSIRTLLSRLPISSPPALCPIIPLHSPCLPLRLNPTKPLTMAIFNATPDSFSDGDPSRTSSSSSLKTLASLLDSWLPYTPDILDIGGMSTRPNAAPCTPEEEIRRVVPLISAIRSSNYSWKNIPISIDTYRADVARAAIEAGGNIINDVRGAREPGMLEMMKEMDVPVILMHSRGDSNSMTTAEVQDYSAQGGVVRGVKKEMDVMVQKAIEGGVKGWNVVLDPGVGFAKDLEGNLTLLRHLPELLLPTHSSSSSSSSSSTSAGVGAGRSRDGIEETAVYPMLIGASRKGFIGKITQREMPAERVVGDTVVTSWCAQSGAVSILRVHDVRAAGEAFDMISAIRGEPSTST